MAIYHAPVEDYRFLLHDWLRVHERADLPGFAELTPELTQPVIDAAARFFEAELHPIHQRADDEGAALVDGRVRTPAGFREAWQRYSEAGWQRLTVDAALGGEGLPPVLGVPNDEMGIACGHAFMMYGAFCPSAAQMLAALGDDWMKAHVVPALVAGRWTATMCLTEPHCGTDLRQLRTRAVAQPDGSWRISGSKIFISGGDHDLTEAIAHIVLAKVPDAQGRIAPGLGSVNVFLVPSRRLDPASGALGGRNAIEVGSIERKMGIGASATCVLNFDEAVGWRIAAAGQGSSANMAAMFMMMNHARVATAMSGVAYADIAYQNARAYARERLSGRAGPTPAYPERVADAIVAHADVRRLLLEARSFAEGARAGAMRAALWQSVAEHDPDPAQRQRAADLLELLTPVMKAFYTDRGFDAAVACQQVLGGHGYIQDYGLEQYVRNARIGQLYEGANGIQATDLVQRKLFARGGRAQRAFVDAVTAFLDRAAQDQRLQEFTQPLARGLQRLASALAWVGERAAASPQAVAAGAYDLLSAMGILYVGWNWAEVAAVLQDPARCRCLDADQREQKLALARVWMQRQMPLIDGLCCRIESGNDSLLSLPDAWI